MSNYIILTPFFPSPNSFRGTYLLDQIKSIKKNTSLEVMVIITSPFYEKGSGNYTIEGINCITFKLIDFPSFFMPGFFNSINFYRFKHFLLKHHIKLNSDTIVHGHINYPASALLKYLKTNFNCFTILQHHGLDILQRQTGQYVPILKKIQNKRIHKESSVLFKFIDLQIVVSQRMKSELLKIDDTINSKVYICINGVDSSKFYCKPKQEKESKYIIGCIANFWKLKDQMTLLKAVNRLYLKGLKNIEIIFVGTGDTLKKCQDYAQKNYLDCIFIKSVSHNDLLDFYNKMDLFVLPSYYEAFGCVYLEAMACGIPFIAVKNQGIEDVIEEDYKKIYLMEARNDLELSKLIEQQYQKATVQPFNNNFEINMVTKKLLNHINQLK